ncbi:glycosyltransferase family 2 protein [Humibacter sp. RRB41]|uniref:glycosyltransferase family 2 protein n=1 Tax=Humibacter sp. RRB41 TaxID=2919946 RepID=UPI001FA94459|nr:glycosyltransferase family 2 protein [Humibacter sp. RRB41]
MKIPIVDVVLPCLNEAPALPGLLSALPCGYRAIVVDNGSTDGSAEVATRLGATVVREPVRGFGSAVHTGLLASAAPVVAFCDCDGSFDLAELPRIVEPVRDGAADLVLGRRVSTPRSWPLPAKMANRLLAARLRSLTGVPVRDLGPMRAARRDDLLELDLRDRRSGYPLEMFLKAHASGWRIAEVDVSYLPRIGRSKVTGTARGYLGAVRDMSRLLHAETR